MSRDLIEVGLGWGYRPGKVRRLIDDVDTVALVACVRDCLVGFAIMAFGEEHAHLVLLAVQPAHRRRGIGRLLVNWLLESAITAGIASVHLELPRQHGAKGFAAPEVRETLGVPAYYRPRIRRMHGAHTAPGSPAPRCREGAITRNGEQTGRRENGPADFLKTLLGVFSPAKLNSSGGVAGRSGRRVQRHA
jgi:GNAT superfamily N-acetyltransferase